MYTVIWCPLVCGLSNRDILFPWNDENPKDTQQSYVEKGLWVTWHWHSWRYCMINCGYCVCRPPLHMQSAMSRCSEFQRCGVGKRTKPLGRKWSILDTLPGRQDCLYALQRNWGIDGHVNWGTHLLRYRRYRMSGLGSWKDSYKCTNDFEFCLWISFMYLLCLHALQKQGSKSSIQSGRMLLNQPCIHCGRGVVHSWLLMFNGHWDPQIVGAAVKYGLDVMCETDLETKSLLQSSATNSFLRRCRTEWCCRHRDLQAKSRVRIYRHFLTVSILHAGGM
jgi:hypothetical protein